MPLFNVDFLQSDNHEVVVTKLIPSYYRGLSEIAQPDRDHLDAFDGFWDSFHSEEAIAQHMHESERSQAEWLIILGRGVLAGAMYVQRLHFPTPTVNTGYWIASPFTNRGLASGALRMVSDHVLSRQEADVMIASPRVDNIASKKTLEAAGYTAARTFIHRISGHEHQVYEKYRFLHSLPDQS